MKRLLQRRQPRIRGTVREGKHSYLLPSIQRGLEKLAISEGKSVSWIIAELISDYFDIDSSTGLVLRKRKHTKKDTNVIAFQNNRKIG